MDGKLFTPRWLFTLKAARTSGLRGLPRAARSQQMEQFLCLCLRASIDSASPGPSRQSWKRWSLLLSPSNHIFGVIQSPSPTKAQVKNMAQEICPSLAPHLHLFSRTPILYCMWMASRLQQQSSLNPQVVPLKWGVCS